VVTIGAFCSWRCRESGDRTLVCARWLTPDCSPIHTSDVAIVDPDDDTIQRYVVRHYAHDPERRERRHQVVAAFDNEMEFLRLFERLNEDLRRRREAGDPVEPSEHFTGVMLEPGYRRRQQDGRILMRLIRHGATISDDLLAQLELPRGMAYVRSRADGDG
jgi:hypothetical protein